MRRKGLTLIEVLIIVVMIGILLTLVFQKFRDRKRTDEAATLLGDLGRVKTAESVYFTGHRAYGTLAQLGSASLFSGTPGHTVAITVAPTGYVVTSTDTASRMICTLAVTAGEAGASRAQPACAVQ